MKRNEVRVSHRDSRVGTRLPRPLSSVLPPSDDVIPTSHSRYLRSWPSFPRTSVTFSLFVITRRSVSSLLSLSHCESEVSWIFGSGTSVRDGWSVISRPGIQGSRRETAALETDGWSWRFDWSFSSTTVVSPTTDFSPGGLTAGPTSKRVTITRRPVVKRSWIRSRVSPTSPSTRDPSRVGS